MIERAWNSAVAWSWGYTGLRLASGILLLPLLLQFSNPDMGIYYVLLSLAALVPMLDMGLCVSFDRSVSYAMGGATTLKDIGVAEHDGVARGPNFELLWKLLHSARRFYQVLAGVVLVVLGGWGTYVVGLRIGETTNASLSWTAWWLTLAGCVFEMYAGWWGVYLRALNRVLTSARIGFASQLVRLALAAGLLISGAGLLSVPIAAILSSILQRHVARRACLDFLSASAMPPEPSGTEIKTILRMLWPNSWRVGLHLLATYLTANIRVFICLSFLGLDANAMYGLSMQAVTISQAIAQAWLNVKWPYIFQLRARHAEEEIQTVFRPRFWLMLVTYPIMALAVLAFAPGILRWIHAKTHLLPEPWMVLILVFGFLEMILSAACTLIVTSNRTPFLKATVVTNCASLVLILLLLNTTTLGIGALVLGPLLAGLVYNYWHWIAAAARDIKTTLPRLLFERRSDGRQ